MKNTTATHVSAVATSPSPKPSSDDFEQGVMISNDSTMTLTSYTPSQRKIAYNPSAGEVHRRERDALWRIEVDAKIRQANAKAREDQTEKRRWGLAKQVQGGLMHNFGINYGVAELSTLIKQGMALKGGTDSTDKRELTAQEVAYVQFLAAVEKYDLKQVVLLLDKFPKGRNKKK